MADTTSIIERLIQQESLPASYDAAARKVILPLAQHIKSLRQQRQHPVVVGIHGAQGTGKSTLTLFLREFLNSLYGVQTASFSLDDLYLTRAERQKLAAEKHPLLITRGVPGTHDLALGQQLIDRLTSATDQSSTPIPVFDKARDDRAPESDWPLFQGRADVVLIEGWCLGALPEPSLDSLNHPINELESAEDPQGIWRQTVNDYLKSTYADFFGQLDCLIMLQAPSMNCILQWRTLQEHKLRERIKNAPETGIDGSQQAVRIMTDPQVARFIMHYERITRACLAEMPSRADVVVPVDAQHNFGKPLFHQRQ